MTWDNIFKLLLSMLVSVGGAGFLILALSNWLGKIWAKKINDEYKANLDKEIESYKSELESIRNDYQRFASKKFMIIEETWLAMHSIVDEMTIYNPNHNNYLSEIINVVTRYCRVINRNSLFFSDEIQKLLNDYVSACSDVTYSISEELKNNIGNIDNKETVQKIIENIYKKANTREEILKKIKLEFKRELGVN